MDHCELSIPGRETRHTRAAPKERFAGHRTRVKHAVGAVLVLALVLAAANALALSRSYVVQYLFGRSADSVQAQRMEAQVQPVDIVHRSDTVLCTVKDAYFDGQTLAVGLGFQSAQHVYLIADELRVNGDRIDYVEYGSSIEEMWVGHHSPAEDKEAGEEIHGVQYTLRNPLPKGEAVEVTLSLTMLAPQKGVREVDISQADKPSMWAAIDAAYASGLTPFSADEPYEVLVSSGWWDGELDHHSALCKPYCDVDALVQYANMDVLDTLQVSFVLLAH